MYKLEQQVSFKNWLSHVGASNVDWCYESQWWPKCLNLAITLEINRRI